MQKTQQKILTIFSTQDTNSPETDTVGLGAKKAPAFSLVKKEEKKC
jgi:hypothetical protein